MTAPGIEQTAGGLAFATPGDWFPLRVPRERADADVLASQIIAARPDLRREAVEQMARSLVDACASLDVLSAYTTALDVPGGPLPATLVASVYPAGGADVGRVAEWMAAGGDSVAAPEAARFDLPAGRTARIERLREQVIPGREQRLVSLVVQYVTAIPGTGNVILLTFSTPAVALARPLRQLFHQIACTLRFEPQEQPR